MSVMSVIFDQTPITTPRDFTRAIIADVARKHGVTVAEILSTNRARRIIAARFEAIRAVSEARPHLSTPVIGRMFRKDHSSILFARGTTKKTVGKWRTAL